MIFGIVVVTFFAMEFVAWATHKYVMHGWLWNLHADHHKKDHYNFLERNDSFFLIFAVPSMLLFFWWEVSEDWTHLGYGSVWVS
jgi:beta-carotene 3-hydroxylase